jgi:XTP/dITP diphosphohydrolase
VPEKAAMPPDWYYTTSNPEKLREFRHVFGTSSRIGYLSIPVMEILEVELEKLIVAKATEAYRAARVPVLVEHGALCIDALNGLPGALVKPVWTALGTGLCSLVPPTHRTARVRSAFCFCDGRERKVLLAEVEGEIASTPAGNGGFHWDPLFIPKGETRTFAEMAETSLDEKLRFSPFGKLQAELRQKLGL